MHNLSKKKILAIIGIIVALVALPIIIFQTQKSQDIRQRAAGVTPGTGDTKIFLSQATGNQIAKNTAFNVELKLNANNKSVSNFTVELIYDSNKFTYNSIQKGADLDTVTANPNIAASHIRILAEANPTAPINTNDVLVATLSFTSKNEAGNGIISFADTPLNVVGKNATGSIISLTAEAPDITYTIVDAATLPPTNTPAPTTASSAPTPTPNTNPSAASCTGGISASANPILYTTSNTQTTSLSLNGCTNVQWTDWRSSPFGGFNITGGTGLVGTVTWSAWNPQPIIPSQGDKTSRITAKVCNDLIGTDPTLCNQYTIDITLTAKTYCNTLTASPTIRNAAGNYNETTFSLANCNNVDSVQWYANGDCINGKFFQNGAALTNTPPNHEVFNQNNPVRANNINSVTLRNTTNFSCDIAAKFYHATDAAINDREKIIRVDFVQPTNTPTPTSVLPNPTATTAPNGPTATSTPGCPDKNRGDFNCDSFVWLDDLSLWAREKNHIGGVNTLTSDIAAPIGTINIVDLTPWVESYMSFPKYKPKPQP